MFRFAISATGVAAALALAGNAFAMSSISNPIAHTGVTLIVEVQSIDAIPWATLPAKAAIPTERPDFEAIDAYASTSSVRATDTKSGNKCDAQSALERFFFPERARSKAELAALRAKVNSR